MDNKNKEISSNNKTAHLSMYEFAKQYITIKDAEGNKQKFNDRQLNEIKEVEKMEEMTNKGYEPKLVRLRKGTELYWVKK